MPQGKPQILNGCGDCSRIEMGPKAILCAANLTNDLASSADFRLRKSTLPIQPCQFNLVG
jgi:hypothetical protein